MVLRNPKRLVEALSREDFLRELHHLLWIEPQLNNGQRDEGWNCRDHALIVAGVAQMLGFTASVIHGRATFVQGPRQTPTLWASASPHSWVGVEGAKQSDLSIRLRAVEQFPSWRDWEVSAMVADWFLPADRARIVHVDSPEELLERQIALQATSPGRTAPFTTWRSTKN